MTKRRKKSLSEEEIDALVIAEADDPTAWGDPVAVSASNSPRPAWMAQSKHLDLAAKFYVLSVLHRMGAEATLTFSQSDNVDITVIQASGHVLTVDVKTLTGGKEWFVSPFRAAKNHFLVFVWYPATDKPNVLPSVYVVASRRLRQLLDRKQTGSISLDVLSRELSAQDAWQDLTVAPAA